MTIAKEMGFVVGEKYTVLNGSGGGSDVGEVLIFSEDDDSNCPYFENTDGEQVCPYLSAFMVLPQKEVKNEVNAESVEDFIQKRNEAKESLSQSQKELDEKLESLGLQEINGDTSPFLSENFNWVQYHWSEFNVGDGIKAISRYGEEVFEGTVSICEDESYDGDMVLAINYINDEKEKLNWMDKEMFYFCKKVAK